MELDPTLLAGILTGIGGAIVTAVSVLWKRLINLQDKYLEHAIDLAEVKGRHHGIEHLSKEVLQTVENAIKHPHNSNS